MVTHVKATFQIIAKNFNFNRNYTFFCFFYIIRPIYTFFFLKNIFRKLMKFSLIFVNQNKNLPEGFKKLVNFTTKCQKSAPHESVYDLDSTCQPIHDDMRAINYQLDIRWPLNRSADTSAFWHGFYSWLGHMKWWAPAEASSSFNFCRNEWRHSRLAAWNRWPSRHWQMCQTLNDPWVRTFFTHFWPLPPAYVPLNSE